MSISGHLNGVLQVAFADIPAANECAAILNTAQADTEAALPAKVAPVVPVVVTFSAGGTPANYTTPVGTLTIANSTTPTVVELLEYCDELRGNIASLEAVLLAAGLVT